MMHLIKTIKQDNNIEQKDDTNNQPIPRTGEAPLHHRSRQRREQFQVNRPLQVYYTQMRKSVPIQIDDTSFEDEITRVIAIRTVNKFIEGNKPKINGRNSETTICYPAYDCIKMIGAKVEVSNA